VLSHRSAARLWGLLRSGTGGIEVTTPRTRQARTGLTVHTTRCLTTADRGVMEAIPVTSVATLGIQVLRVTWTDLQRPAAVAREITDVYAARCAPT
jgi:regulator of protease activity HflC (stomatin/prohibitin superfamily)